RWFRPGDGDLATHVERTRRLKRGESLSAISDDFRGRLGIAAPLLPMSDDPVRTRLHTAPTPPSPASGGGLGGGAGGWLDFQDYFVRLRWEPVIDRLEFAGAGDARPLPGFLAA